MNRVMLIYPPGKLYQRSEDRAQCNIEYSSAASVHACNDLGYCAAILKKNGYEIFLRDYEIEYANEEILKKDILQFKPDLIFMSTTNATIADDLKIIKNIKSYHNCIFVLKGALFYNPEISLLKKLPLEYGDCFIGGEVEFIILPVVNFFLKGLGNLSEITGICYFKNNQLQKSFFGCWQKDLDSLPFPDRSVMRNDLYVRPDTGEAMATISVARGCPSECIYCLTPIISGKKVRFRSTDNVFAEIEECFYQYGIKNFFFKADTFTINHKWVKELCDKIIASELWGKIEFTVNARADTISFPIVKKLKKAGCFTIAVGFESGNEKSLKRMKKNTTVEQNLKAAKIIKSCGLPIFGFFMLGFPWETQADLLRTVNHIFAINPDYIEISIAMPFYGTDLFRICKEHGLINDMAFGCDYFLNPNISGTKYVSLECIKKVRKKALLSFYLRPWYIAGKVVHAIDKPIVIKNYVNYGFRLLKNLI